MIQLANDPNASRIGSTRPAPSEGKGRSLEHPRSRGGHAWPFISRHSSRTVPPTTRSSNSDSGS